MRIYDLPNEEDFTYPYVVDMGDQYILPDNAEKWANENTKGVIFGSHYYFKTIEDRTLFIMRWSE